MTTVEDTQEIANSVDVPVDGAHLQEAVMVNPTILTPVTGEVTTSHDNSSNQNAMESLISIYGKWRTFQTKVVETSTPRGNLMVVSGNLHLLDKYCTVGNPVLGRYRAELANPGDPSFIRFAYTGIRFDVELRFKIYSSCQQQGALYFIYTPALHFANTDANLDPNDFVDTLQKGTICSLADKDLSLDKNLFTRHLQCQHKIISFGGETEVEMRIPYLLKYDFANTHNIADRLSWGAVMVGVMDPLVVRTGTYDKVTILSYIRFTNVQLMGPSFSDAVTNMGVYDYSTIGQG